MASEELREAEEMLQQKENELAEVQRTLEEAVSKKQTVLAEAQKCHDKMDAATALIGGLVSEKIRWTEQISSFKSETDRLVGDVCLLTAFLSYTGPYNQEFRTYFLNLWTKHIVEKMIPISASVNVIDNLTHRSQIGEWNIQGLPTDELSIQNGIVATKACRFPLLIDPQSQGKVWIKNMEKQNQLIITTLNHKYFRNHLEDSVSLGLPIIIEDVAEELDPCLDNLLDRNLLKVGTQYKIKIGDKEIDWNPEFRCYITTKLPNPSYTPEIFARTSIIDFTVTMRGLEDQLLGRVIVTERKELEDERVKLVETVTINMKKIKELEANLLHKLSTTQGSLLDDVTVIEVLNTSKTTAIDVKEKIEVAKVTEGKINAAREEYRVVATRGSVLYFLVCSMTMVNNMYQTSLVQFLDQFDASMRNSAKTHIAQKRIKRIINYLTLEIYRYKSRGLFEKDKFLFVLLMALSIDLRYMLCEVQHGWRVTDDYDKRLLNTFTRVWFHDALFEDNFNFFKGYIVYCFKERDSYISAIDNMLNIDPPQVYGFNSNAEITYQTNTIRSILEEIMSIQPKGATSGTSEVREDRVARQVREMLSKTPPAFDLFDVKQVLIAAGDTSSMNIFLRQEIDRMQRIILLVRSTFKDLLLAIEGSVIMSENLRDALDNIFNARVPTVFKRGSWISSTLGFWFTELIDRHTQFYNWCFISRPVVFWMSGFFNPQGFLTAMRQEVARGHQGWALDQVTMHNDALKVSPEECKKPPKEGVFVHGLYVEGAGWDRRTSRLVESTNKVLFALMPVIHIYAIYSTATKNPKLYTCPVYKKINRTDLNYICPLWLQSNKPPDHWILRGVALLCDVK
ncbi:GH11347 [Drosophila grimshawi]|uniref:GH11347 n=1 Tax=Drosophila grimshawi TaxID=7222 RepID=B4K244_DROGR|nr:GH11347 [Drosophila grimshawi]